MNRIIIAVPTNIRIINKVIGVPVGTCKASRKIVQDAAIRKVDRAINCWFYNN